MRVRRRKRSQRCAKRSPSSRPNLPNLPFKSAMSVRQSFLVSFCFVLCSVLCRHPPDTYAFTQEPQDMVDSVLVHVCYEVFVFIFLVCITVGICMYAWNVCVIFHVL